MSETKANDASRGRPYTFLDYVAFLITNARLISDPGMEATDCWAVTLSDMAAVQQRFTSAQQAVHANQTRIADLQKALLTFGSHLNSCHINNIPRSDSINVCDCGFNDALGVKADG